MPLRVHVETTADTVGCGTCGTRARVKDRRPVALVDLAAFGRPAVLVWHKRRWCCVELDCSTSTFTEQAPAIAAPRAKVADRAGRWVTAQVGRDGRSVAEVKRADVDEGLKPGRSTADAARIRELEGQVKELERANQILRKASAYFAQAELDRP